MTALTQALTQKPSGILESIDSFLPRNNQKALGRHILHMHRLQTVEELVNETAAILKNILSYKLFAFVIQDGAGLNIWSDPLLSRQRLLDMTARDFPGAEIETLTYIEGENRNVIHTFFHKPESVSATLIEVQDTRACLYLVHGQSFFPSRKKSADIVIQSFENALTQILKIRQLEMASSTDPLTGCYNRRAMNRILERSVDASRRYKRELSVIMLDVDHFKSINDTHGHLFGDSVLKSMVASVKKSIRKSDCIARYGGEEFVVILPETPLKGAVEIANRLKSMIGDLPFHDIGGKEIRVTASCGVASMNSGSDMDSLIGEADAMLYQAKNTGRNRVVSACA